MTFDEWWKEQTGPEKGGYLDAEDVACHVWHVQQKRIDELNQIIVDQMRELGKKVEL